VASAETQDDHGLPTINADVWQTAAPSEGTAPSALTTDERRLPVPDDRDERH
jgi:hypothetical protein